MTMLLKPHDIEALKRELGNLLPQVKSSHRVEAMARGLGFATNAALREYLRGRDIYTHVDDDKFEAYLDERNFTLPLPAALNMAADKVLYTEGRMQIIAVMEAHADLTASGFIFHDGKNAKGATPKAYDFDRAQMVNEKSIEHFHRAIEFLSKQRRRQTINRRRTSEVLKKDLEQYSSDTGLNNIEVGHGMIIAAAIHLGFRLKREGRVVMFDIEDFDGRRDASLAQYLTKGGRSQAWRNLMVAAINAGLAQKKFGLGEGENRWGEAREGIYSFEFIGLPAIVFVCDGAYSELRVNVALNPQPDGHHWIHLMNAGFLAGDGFASGTVERRHGKWLQDAHGGVGKFRNKLIATLAAQDIKPRGYSDHSPFI